MERLTVRDEKGVAALACREGCKGGPACFECEQKAVDRLAAYEDTDLEPEAVAQLKKIAEIFNCDASDPAQLKALYDKLQELAQAERDGRLVVLPCKVGDTVYEVYHPYKCVPVITERRVETLTAVVNLVGKMGRHLVVDTYLTRQEAEAAVERLKGEGEHG